MSMESTDFQPVMILGAAKSGTTSIYTWIDQHPDICMTHPKEPYFFYTKEFEYGFDFYVEKYLKRWDGKQRFGEASQRNLYFHHAPERIKAFFPNARFIIILRDPAARAISHYWHNFRRKKEYLSFDRCIEEELKRLDKGVQTYLPPSAELRHRRFTKYRLGYYRSYLETGHYDEHIERYFKLFDQDRFKILLFEDMVQDPASAMADIFRFCELDDSHRVNINFSPENQSRALSRSITFWPHRLRNLIYNWRHYPTLQEKIAGSLQAPVITRETRDWLNNYFAPHNRRLEMLTGLDLSPWAVHD